MSKVWTLLAESATFPPVPSTRQVISTNEDRSILEKQKRDLMEDNYWTVYWIE